MTGDARVEVLEGGASGAKGRAWAGRSMALAALALFTGAVPLVSGPAALGAVASGARALWILRRSEPVPGARFWAWSGLVVGSAVLALLAAIWSALAEM